MQPINSRSNPTVRALRSLQTKKGRASEAAYLIEGEKMIREAAAASVVPSRLIVSVSAADTALIRLLPDVPVTLVSDAIMEYVCDTVSPQGVAAVLPIRPVDLPEAPRFSVVLDGLSDPGNIGTVIRTADAVGADCVVLSEACADLYSPKIIRASMGSVFHLPVVPVPSLEAYLRARRAEGCRILSSALDGAPFEDYVPGAEPIVLLVGNEAHGVSALSSSLSDQKLRIAMRGRAESYNAAVAAGIMMYGISQKIYQ
ncbi:MAG: RNA methyltransferase [Eubacteriales bacterium]|nr:RNA methyltransferase [Eubacteriales bacterium]